MGSKTIFDPSDSTDVDNLLGHCLVPTQVELVTSLLLAETVAVRSLEVGALSNPPLDQSKCELPKTGFPLESLVVQAW